MWQKAQKMYMKAAQLEVDNNLRDKIRQKIANIESQVQSGGRSPASLGTPKPQ
jgi:hypothetical protein